MYVSVLLISAFGAAALAAPSYPELNVNSAAPGAVDVVSGYFNMLAQKVEASRSMSSAPACDLSNAQLPQDTPTALPSPSAGLTLKHVAIGRGTQNYTCDPNNATAVPVSIGAWATLYNASCVAALYPDLLAILPQLALQFNLTGPDMPQMPPTNLAISGHHFFRNLTTPFFDLDTPALQLGEAPCSKNNTEPAPAGSPKGPLGEGAVAWLKLVARDGATGDLQEVYRVATAGGAPPATCADMPATFEVPYSAQYWFWQRP